MSLVIVLLAYVGLECAVGGPLELPQLSGKGWTTLLVRQVDGAPRCWVVHSRPRTPIRLMASFPPSLDGDPSVLLSSLSKNSTLVTAGSRVGRCCGNVVIGVGPTSQWLLLRSWGRRVHHGRSISGPPTPACTGSIERRHEGPAGSGSSLLAKLLRLQMVALHSSSFSATGGKLRSSHAHQRFCWRGRRRKLHGP